MKIFTYDPFELLQMGGVEYSLGTAKSYSLGADWVRG